MGWKIILNLIFVLFVISLFVFYWFVPFKTIEFGIKSGHSNFTLNDSDNGNMQFYSRMRFPSQRISYRIDNCPLQKEDNMEEAFEMLSNLTLVNFYPKSQGEEIYVTCDSKNRIEGDLFIAGEGGPTNITKTENFNIILNGEVLLIRESQCPTPNIGIHELLHVLGFNHSDNPNNIMYYLSKCGQTIGQDQIDLINQLYSIPTYADLAFENVSSTMNGRYLDANISIRNHGLKISEKTSIVIYADGKLINEIELDPIEIGFGRTIIVHNIWVSQINVEQLEFFIDSNFEELEKNNNRIILQIKED
jgi:hypothetical protein